MCDATTLQNIFCKKIHHTHTSIIVHTHVYCNAFSQKSVDNFLIFIFEKFTKYFL
jgi:hypothetical protein